MACVIALSLPTHCSLPLPLPLSLPSRNHITMRIRACSQPLSPRKAVQ
jgi:hypothetical protein